MMRYWKQALAVALATVAVVLPARADVLPLSAEISIGREAAQVVEAQYPLSSDPALLARVQRIGRRVAGVCGRPDLPFEFHVVDTPDINAFCLPGGFVYVFRGLLQGVPNDDALAFIIGHEIAHAVHRHALRQFEKSQIVRIVTAPLTGAIGTFGRDVVRVVVGRHFSRDDEREADQEGLLYATRAGFDAQGGVRAMETLLQLVGTSRHPEFLSDHPDTRRRKEALEALARELEKKPEPGPAPAPAVAPPEPWGPPPAALTPTPLLPLAVGNTWTYRVSGRDGAPLKATVRVTATHPAAPGGVFCMETAYENGPMTRVWVAPVAGGILTQRCTGAPDTPWRTEWAWNDESSAASTPRGTVTVPAGEFQCVRVRRLAADGTVTAEAWFAEGTGLVKCVWPGDGITQELTSYRLADRRVAAAP